MAILTLLRYKGQRVSVGRASFSSHNHQQPKHELFTLFIFYCFKFHFKQHLSLHLSLLLTLLLQGSLMPLVTFKNKLNFLLHRRQVHSWTSHPKNQSTHRPAHLHSSCIHSHHTVRCHLKTKKQDFMSTRRSKLTLVSRWRRLNWSVLEGKSPYSSTKQSTRRWTYFKDQTEVDSCRFKGSE